MDKSIFNKQKVYNMVNDLFVFDFDDTLATTVANIGIARTYNKKNDELFRSWLLEHELYPVDEKETSGLTYFYLPSDEFAKYQKFASDSISENVVDHFDFADTAKINNDATKKNSAIINVLKKAESLPSARVIIVTARANDEMDTPFGKITATNREDIEDFLKGVGSKVNQSQIFPVGSSNPADKANIVRKYIESLHPKTVHFYDDNELNLDAIHQLCDEFAGVPNIITHKVSDGIPEQGVEC